MKTRVIKNVTPQVEALLQDTPDTRNCDTQLWARLLGRYYKAEATEMLMGLREVIAYSGANVKFNHNLPSFESVRRARQKFQAEGRYLPTSKEVIAERKLTEKVYLHSARSVA